MSPPPDPRSPGDPRHEKVKDVFFDASQVPTQQRSAFLDEACAGDPALRNEVEDLLKYVSEELADPVIPMKTLDPGRLIAGRFRLVRKVGEGGMGQVYEAIDSQLPEDAGTLSGARVALKIIRPELSGAKGIEAQFRRELVLARQIGHANVCNIFDIGCHAEPGEPEMLFLSMEFLSGETLTDRLKKAKLNRLDVRDLASQLFAGLNEVHRHGIVHRDLKPGNIHLVPERETVRLVLTDFGLARSLAPLGPTVTRMLAGTPGYTAPEQFETGECSVRADIYSLGVVLYEMVVGARFDAVNARRFLQEKAPDWSEIILRCVDKEPQNRPENVAQVQEAFFRPRWLSITPRAQRIAFAGILVAAVCGLTWAAVRLSHDGNSASPPQITRVTFDRGLATEPSVALDGNRMVYTTDRASNGVFSIWRHNIADGTSVQITRADAHATSPAISPDGKWVAYRSERLGGGVYLVPAGGGDERLIGPYGRHPFFSHDSRNIVYWTGQEGDYSAPTGKIWVVERSTGKRQQLASDFGDARFPVWASDGDQILFRGSRDKTVRWNSQTDWWVTDGVSEPVRTGAFDILQKAGLTLHDSRIFWAGNQILFGARSGHSTNLWSLPVSGKTARPAGSLKALTTGTDTEMAPWLVSQTVIAYSHKVSLGHILRIALHNGQPEATTQVTEEDALDTRPTISKDGKHLLFTRRLGENREVLVSNLETGEQKSVLRNQPAVPFLSPDGTRVAFSMPLQERNPIYLLGADGGQPRRICEDCGEVAGWDPDGKHVLFLCGKELAVRSLVGIDVETGSRRELIPPFSGLTDISLSSSGIVAFSVRAEGTQSRIFVAPVPQEGSIVISSSIAVTEPDSWSDKPRWSPDGKTLYYLSERDGFVCVWRLAMSTRLTGDTLGIAHFSPEAVYHNHRGRYDLHHLSRPAQGLGVSVNSVVLNIPDINGKIWLLRTLDRSPTSPTSFLRFFLPR
jgi:serine/threonine protein kinase/Tol biopolymer transport system component